MTNALELTDVRKVYAMGDSEVVALDRAFEREGFTILGWGDAGRIRQVGSNLVANADQLARRVEVGMLWVNMPAWPTAEMPFGGVKQSGMGREGGHESLDAYTTTKMVSLKTARV